MLLDMLTSPNMCAGPVLDLLRAFADDHHGVCHVLHCSAAQNKRIQSQWLTQVGSNGSFFSMNTMRNDLVTAEPQSQNRISCGRLCQL